MFNSALQTDYYELTMAQGFYLSGNNPRVVFDMFYRTNPYNGGYVVFAGLHELLYNLANFSFSKEDLAYLKERNFRPEFLEFLADFRFSGTVHSMDEGTIVFPNEPLIRIEASLIEAQLIEGMLLNTINFQSLIATKACRINVATKGQSEIMEFGLRRAQGPNGALGASRAAFIGGAGATSNTLAGRLFNIPVAGTMAHSWIMAFESELEAFREFAKIYPDNCVLLIDTYDALGSGLENAIIVGKEQQSQGHSIGVRLDSGDLNYLSREIRKRFDAEGLPDTKIYASNDLTEEIIDALVRDQVPIDSWGVGTHLVTGGAQSSLNGVYKLAAKLGTDKLFEPTMKISNSFEKATNPGIKQVWRFFDRDQQAIADLVALDDEHFDVHQDITFHHPLSEADFFVLKASRGAYCKPLLKPVMQSGKAVVETPTLQQLQGVVKESLGHFHSTYKRLINPHIYKVSLSRRLRDLKIRLTLEGRAMSQRNHNVD